LECDSKGEDSGRGVYFSILRAEIPKVVGIDDGEVVALDASAVALARDEANV
jgi:hypothetical protein